MKCQPYGYLNIKGGSRERVVILNASCICAINILLTSQFWQKYEYCCMVGCVQCNTSQKRRRHQRLPGNWAERGPGCDTGGDVDSVFSNITHTAVEEQTIFKNVLLFCYFCISVFSSQYENISRPAHSGEAINKRNSNKSQLRMIVEQEIQKNYTEKYKNREIRYIIQGTDAW